MITPIGHGESNAAIHFAIAMLVVEISMNMFPITRIGDYFLMPMISPELQLDLRANRCLDLFDMANLMPPSILPGVRWFCRYGQSRFRYSCFFNRMMKRPKSCPECRTTARLDLFDQAISMLPSMLR